MMASMIAFGEFSSKRSPSKYDVFLSFRGEDTRKNFADHLYTALHQKNIVTYRDDSSLKKGQNISNELLKAIENSKYLVVIMSSDYASSTWCLEELAKIVECMKGGKQIAIPIFYKVDPSDVRKQKGSFESAFKQHEATFKDDMDKVPRWKNAMEEIANLAGWDLLDRHESNFIRDIVEDLQNKLGKKSFYAPKNLVGIESRIKDTLLHLSLGSNDVRFIGISGMGGIGKSTLARAVFDEISSQFDGCSFLANMKEVSDTYGLVRLQNKLLFDVLQEKDLIGDVIAGASVIEEKLKHRRVLVVLDDADRMDHLENLVGKSWIGLGSRVIITTRDEHLLLRHRVDVVYKAKELSNGEALELFCSKALGGNNPIEEFASFSKKVVEYAKGLPLALTVLGSFLFGRNMIEWQSALARLQETPHKQIFDTLRLSIDGLEEKDKAIFLDIACFFTGEDKNNVLKILKYWGFNPEIGVKILIERSLLTIIDDKFMVHDLLREMAWEVVRQESPQEPGKRSRLWHFDDINLVIASNMGTEKIEGIALRLGHPDKEIDLNASCFEKMINLRLLLIEDPEYQPKINYLPNSSPEKIKANLPNKLRLLTWDGFPFHYLPTNFLPKNLCELNLRRSRLRKLWMGEKEFKELEFIDLSYSSYLKETPNFEKIPNLESLILKGCENLSWVHPSIGVLQNLKFLDLSGCQNLTKLPYSICNLKSLQILECDGCIGLNLWDHFLFRRVRGILLPSLSGVSSLLVLNMSKCHLEEGRIPNDLGCLSSLRYLNLSYNDFITLPESISQIPQLEVLELDACENLQVLPRLPESILYVNVEQCWNLRSISNLFMICSSRNSRNYFFNCLKFLPEDLEVPLAEKHSLALLCYVIAFSLFPSFQRTHVFAPSFKIPKWFTYQKDGSFLSFSIRDNLFKDKVIGFAICVSFHKQEQERRRSDSKHVINLLCNFYVHSRWLGDLGPTFLFPIDPMASNFLWMGFVDLNDFGLDTNDWVELLNEPIDVSLATTDRRLKVRKCAILPVQRQQPGTFEKFIQSASLSAEDAFSIFHGIVYEEVDCHVSRSLYYGRRNAHRWYTGKAKIGGVDYSSFGFFLTSQMRYLWSRGCKLEEAASILGVW